jgi:hypothetical protein
MEGFFPENPKDIRPDWQKADLRFVDPLVDQNEMALFGSNVAYQEHNYHRLSSSECAQIKAEHVHEDLVWLAGMAAGLQLKFETDSRYIVLDVLLSGPADMCHMPASGQTCFDCYVFDDESGKYHFHSAGLYDLKCGVHYQSQLVQFPFSEKKNHRYIVNFPLYQGIESLRVGFEKNARVLPVKFAEQKPIVLYGTSIAQGGVVSHPGMLYTNILSRELDREFLNYGFSGAALADPLVGSILSSRHEAALFIIDCEANAGCDEKMRDNLPSFIANLRQGNENVPILLLNRIPFALDRYDHRRKAMADYYSTWLQNLVKANRKKGMPISFVDARKFFPAEVDDGTVDGVHPSDLGAYYLAKGQLAAIKKALNL